MPERQQNISLLHIRKYGHSGCLGKNSLGMSCFEIGQFLPNEIPNMLWFTVIFMFEICTLYLQICTQAPGDNFTHSLFPSVGPGSTEVTLSAPYIRLSGDLRQKNQRPLPSYRPVYHPTVLRTTPTLPPLSSIRLSSARSLPLPQGVGVIHPSTPTTGPQAAIRLILYKPFFRGSC